MKKASTEEKNAPVLTFGFFTADTAPLWWVDSCSAQQVSRTSSRLDTESGLNTV